MGRTFPTSVGTPVLLENLHSITGKVRPSRTSTSTGFKHCSALPPEKHSLTLRMLMSEIEAT